MRPLLLRSWILALVALGQSASLVAGPGPAQTPQAPTGSTAQLGPGEPVVVGTTHSLRSRVLAQERTVTIGLPRDYAQNQSAYPVLYVLDGGANYSSVHAATEFLARYGEIPPMIVVAPHN